MDEFEQYENGEQFQQQVQNVLQSQDEDLAQKKAFAFYLYVPNEAAAKACAQQIRSIELVCDIEQTSDGSGEWLCYSRGTLLPSSDSLKQIGGLMLQLAQAHKGEFADWELVSNNDSELGQAFSETAQDLDSLFQPDYCATAESILQSIRDNYTHKHEFTPASSTNFADTDMSFYDLTQSKFEQLGFVHVADIEERTITDPGEVHKLVRTMVHPDSKALVTIYAIVMGGPCVYEIESLFNNGLFIITSIAPRECPLTDCPNIQTRHFDPQTPLAELYLAHLEQMSATMSQNPSTVPVAVQDYQAVIAMRKQMCQNQQEALKKTGWVTMDWLKTQSPDEQTAQAVFKEIQKLIAQEQH